MTKNLAINNININVDDDQVDKLIGKFKNGRRSQINHMDDWKIKTTHEPYDFDIFLKKAKEYSDKNPPDIVQFSEKAWGAAAICVTKYYLTNFHILISSHSVKRKLLHAICEGLDGEQGKKLADIWKEAEKSHSNFYKNIDVPKEKREALLKLIREMPDIIKKANFTIVEDRYRKLQVMKSITLDDKKQGMFKIGKNSHPYTRIAYCLENQSK